jgi:hypothetical protein
VPEPVPVPEVLPLVEPVPEPVPVPEVRTGAKHDAVEPPFRPSQLHVHGPVPVTGVAMPARHNEFFLGLKLTATPFAAPHCPFTGPSICPKTKLRFSFIGFQLCALAGVMASTEAMTNTFQIFICIAFS